VCNTCRNNNNYAERAQTPPRLLVVSETAAALLEKSARAPPVESKYIAESRICVVDGSGKVIVDPHPAAADQHQKLTTSRGSPLSMPTVFGRCPTLAE